ncbi:MAG TPA: hypothetical protein VMB50_06635 [Myxococcales bacterium]|nr:hypothetical protein [Myxococcales bacterium]
MLTDCDSLYATCDGTTCVPVPCGPQFGTSFDGLCDFADAGTGSCIPFGGSYGYAFNWEAVGLCSQAGPRAVGGACVGDGTVSRDPEAGFLCAAGSICVPNTGPDTPSFLCSPLCNPTVAGSCATYDAGCLAFDTESPWLGICAPANQGQGGNNCAPSGTPCGGTYTYIGCCSRNCNAGTCE